MLNFAKNTSMSDNLQFKNFKIDSVKEEGSDLVIAGWAAYFGNVDSYGDVIEKGAFTKTLLDRGERIAFCYQHDIWNPIAKIQLIEERQEGLWIVARLSAAEQDIQTKIREKILTEMSIGYRTITSHNGTINDAPVNYLTEIMLYEVSLVTIAANPAAVITGMKADEQADYIKKEFDRLIAIIKNENINFEIRKLKSLVLSAAHESAPTQTIPQDTIKAVDIFNMLTKK